MANLKEIIDVIYQILWSDALIYLLLGAGIYFTIVTRAMQIRHIKNMLILSTRGGATDTGVSSFQALTMSLSGRVGVGNIAGVATAIGVGGPGAIFWMWIVALLGASTSFIECTLAQIYKVKQNGQYRGGPAFYIEEYFGGKRFAKVYALLFAIAAIIACGVLLPNVQANAIGEATASAFNINPIYVGTVVVTLMAVVIFGGVKRIATLTEIIVPFMGVGYLLIAFIVIGLNYDKVASVFHDILTSAFGAHAVFGAVFGEAIKMGVKRGIYTNEAGQGTGPHPAGAAAVNHPAEQGIIQAFSVYFVTLIVCTATALMILVTNSYNVEAPIVDAIKTAQEPIYLVQHLPNVDAGPAFTQYAIDRAIPTKFGLGSKFVAVSIFFFAFTTILAYYYIAETNLAYLKRYLDFRGRRTLLRLLLLLTLAYGFYQVVTVNECKLTGATDCGSASALAWKIGDIGVAIMTWLNLIAILWIRRPALQALRDYERKLRENDTSAFNPLALGLNSAHYWIERNNVERKSIEQNQSEQQT